MMNEELNFPRLRFEASDAGCVAAAVAGGGQVCQVRLHPVARADRRGGGQKVKDDADPSLLGGHCQQQVCDEQGCANRTSRGIFLIVVQVIHGQKGQKLSCGDKQKIVKLALLTQPW